MCAFQDRLNAIALGAVLAENLCMLLEFLSTRALQDLETEMIDKTLPAGASPRLVWQYANPHKMDGKQADWIIR